MPLITALLHTDNDALRIGRCLETLYPCDEIVVVDHGSRDGTVQIARAYGARIVAAAPGAVSVQYSLPAATGWILCLHPRESLTESLAASLFEWKSDQGAIRSPRAFSVFLREETAEGWIEMPVAQTRLVPQSWERWNGTLPVYDASSVVLEGELLRFAFP